MTSVEELRSWLESSGGLSLDCLDCLEAAHVNGELLPGLGWENMGMIEKKMETTGIIGVILGLYRVYIRVM